MGHVVPLTQPPARGPIAHLLDALDHEDTDRAGDQLDWLKRYLRELAVRLAANADRAEVCRFIERDIKRVDARLREVDARDRDAYLSPAERRGLEIADIEHARAKDEALAAT